MIWNIDLAMPERFCVCRVPPYVICIDHSGLCISEMDSVTASDRVMFRVMASRGDIQFRIGEGARIPRVISSVEVDVSIREQDGEHADLTMP
jgi:hypothetical protein